MWLEEGEVEKLQVVLEMLEILSFWLLNIHGFN